jgi:hypothetical protein
VSYYAQVSLLIGLLVGVLARDAVRIVLFSVLSLPVLILVGMLGPRAGTASVIERLGDALWSYLAFNGGMVFALIGLVAWHYVTRETVQSARARHQVATPTRDR